MNDRLFKSVGKGDLPLLAAVIAMSVFGVVAVYSASGYVAADYGSGYYFALKQSGGVALGLALMLVTANVDYHVYKKYAVIAFFVGLIILALVFVPGLSVEVYGAKRWVDTGLFTVQPSEISKFTLVLFIAAYFAAKPERSTTFKGILPVLFAGGATCLLIILEPNMSITVCVGATMIAMLFIVGVKKRHLFLIIAPVLILIPLLIVAEPYRLKRLAAFLDPWQNPRGEGYQLLQSLYGLGSGGLFGVGLFNSRQKFRFLPFSESDFILSVIGEETGFFGTTALLVFAYFIIMRCMRAASRASDLFGYLLVMGITSVYAVQVTINALVVTGSIPPTGLPLPLISSGNTSVVVFLAAFGVVYNVSKCRDGFLPPAKSVTRADGRRKRVTKGSPSS